MSASFTDFTSAHPGVNALKRWAGRVHISHLRKAGAAGACPESVARLPTSSGTPTPYLGRAAAIGVHAAALLVLCRLFWPVPPPPEIPAPMTMIFAPPVPDRHVIDLPPASMPAHARIDSAIIAWPPPASIGPFVRRRVSPAPRPAAAEPMPDRQEVVPAPQPAIPGSLKTPDPALMAGFAGQVQRAVQEAAIYPPLARRMHVQGRVQVSFDYEGGTVSAVAVAHASQMPMLDRAAIVAVRDATYPPAPTQFGRQRLPMVVWIDFSMRPEG